MTASSQVKSSLPASSSENGDEHQDSLANRKSAQKVHRLKVRHPKTAAAHWLAKVRKPAGSALYGVQISYKGRRHRFPLETANREAAAEKARGIYLSLVAQGWQGALECYKPKAVVAAKAATIGAWAQCVKETAGLRLSTFTTYLQSLRQIAAEIEGIGDQPVLDELGKPKKDRKGRPVLRSRFDYRSGGRDAWIAKVDALPLTVLTDSAVQRWKLQYIARAGGLSRSA